MSKDGSWQWRENWHHMWWMTKRWMFAAGQVWFLLLLLLGLLTSRICFPYFIWSWWDIFSGRQTQQTVVFFRRLKVLLLSSPSQNVQFSKVFFFCFLRKGRLNLTKESRKLNFKEILLLRVSFSAGNIFLVTVCQGQQSLPLAFQEDQGHCCEQQPDSPESGFGSLSWFWAWEWCFPC